MPFLVRREELPAVGLHTHLACERVSAASAGAELARLQDRTATWKDRTTPGPVERRHAVCVSVPTVGYASLYLSPMKNFQDPAVFP